MKVVWVVPPFPGCEGTWPLYCSPAGRPLQQQSGNRREGSKLPRWDSTTMMYNIHVAGLFNGREIFGEFRESFVICNKKFIKFLSPTGVHIFCTLWGRGTVHKLYLTKNVGNFLPWNKPTIRYFSFPFFPPAYVPIVITCQFFVTLVALQPDKHPLWVGALIPHLVQIGGIYAHRFYCNNAHSTLLVLFLRVLHMRSGISQLDHASSWDMWLIILRVRLYSHVLLWGCGLYSIHAYHTS